MLAALVAAGPWCWRQVRFYWHLRTANYAFEKFAADNAVNELMAAEKIRPDSAKVQFLLGVANRKAGHIDDVRRYLDKAAQLGWSKKDVRFQLTLLAFQAGDKEAEAELQRMMERSMDDDTAEQLCEALALGYLSEYRVSDAMYVLDKWTEWRPDCIRPRLLRSEVYELTNQRAGREEEYKAVIAADPENYAAHMGLATAFLTDHDIDQSLVHYRFCHQQWPADPLPRVGIAGCLQQQGKLAEAKEILNALLDEKIPPPQRASVLQELAKIAQQERQLDAAIEFMKEAVKLDPYSSQLQYLLGVCLAKSGRAEEAKRYTDRSRQIDQLNERRTELELEMLSRPDDANLRFEIGEVLRDLGFPKPSAAMMLSALRWDPGHAGAHAALIHYYEDIGRDDLAAKHRAALGDQQPEDHARDAAQKDAVPQEHQG
ncbi:MAG TPA: tetratricopeptide repeat protein [Candidatus Binataceae bacterium]|nr:tetratricopeptide repeat protein [Candidatus Binataceae bacterium]